MSLTKQFIQNMIIKITRENSSYRERERERERERKHIYLYINICGNQLTNQPTPLRASSYLPRLKLPPPYTARKLRSLAGSLAGSFVTCGICVIDARLQIFFWRLRKKNRNRNRNLCETRTWSFLSIPLQNRVDCVRASVIAYPLLPLLFGFFRRFFFVFFPFKAGTNRVCPWPLVRTLRTNLLCMTFLLIARVFLSFPFLFFSTPFFPFSFFRPHFFHPSL